MTPPARPAVFAFGGSLSLGEGPGYHPVGGSPMTALLQRAFSAAATLPAAVQDALAARLLDELAAEEAFDRELDATGGRLAGLAAAALAEHRAGETAALDPDQL